LRLPCGRFKRLGRGQPAKYEQLWAEHVPLINGHGVNERTNVINNNNNSNYKNNELQL